MGGEKNPKVMNFKITNPLGADLFTSLSKLPIEPRHPAGLSWGDPGIRLGCQSLDLIA